MGKKTQYQNNGWFKIKHREQGINSITQLDDLIKKSADDRQVLLDKIKIIEEVKWINKILDHTSGKLAVIVWTKEDLCGDKLYQI